MGPSGEDGRFGGCRKMGFWCGQRCGFGLSLDVEFRYEGGDGQSANPDNYKSACFGLACKYMVTFG